MNKVLLLIISFFATSAAWCQPKAEGNPKYELLITRVGNMSISDTVKTMFNGMEAEVLLINNSDDTLKFVYSKRPNARFYTSNNENLALANDSDLALLYNKQDTINLELAIIPPHRYLLEDVIFSYHKVPGPNFKFKVGLRLLPWRNEYKASPPDENAIRRANLIWSDEGVFNADKRNDSLKFVKDKRIAKIVYDTLTTKQKKDFILKIDQVRIKAGGGPNCYYPEMVRMIVPVKLINKSDDTLEYVDMSCDWEAVFCADNPKIKVPIECGCDKNAPSFYQVPPHSEKSFDLSVCYDPSLTKSGTHFKLGMILLQYHDDFQFLNFFDSVSMLADSPQHTIWSDEIEVKGAK